MKLFSYIFIFLFSFPCISQTIITIKGVVISQDNSEKIENALVVLKLDGYQFEQKTDTTGKYIFTFSSVRTSTCSVTVHSDKHTKSKSHELGFMATKDAGNFILDSNAIFEKNFLLNPIIGCGRIIHPFFFKTNQIVIYNDSLNKADSLQFKSYDYAINDLIKYLKKEPNLTFEIQGHASSQEKSPQLLSENRAQLIKEILAAKGINRERLFVKGWGNQKLLIPDSIIKKEKTKEEKLILHSKNQRVIFRIRSWDFKE